MPAVSRAVRRNEGWRNQPRWESGREEGGRWKSTYAVSMDEDSEEWDARIRLNKLLTNEESDAVLAYVNDRMINDKLREEQAGQPLPEEYAKQRDLMDAAISKGVVTEPVKVWRGMSTDGLTEYSWREPKDLVGLTFANDAYMSASGFKGTAEDFAIGGPGSGRVVIEINVPSGTNALLVDAALWKRPFFPSEAELLLGRGSHLTFTEASQDEWGDITAKADLRTDLR